MSQWLYLQKAIEASALPPLDKERALAIINQMAPEPVDGDAIHLHRFKLANDQYDRSYERFPVAYLEQFASTLPGRPLLIAHEKNQVGVGKWFAASVMRDTDGTHHLVADAYLPADSEATRLLKLGIAKDVSIGFRAAGRVCDLCGERIDGAFACGHQIGREYDGKRCTATYNGDIGRVEALEGSLVGVGCQIGAEAIGGKEFPAGAGMLISMTEDGMTQAEYDAKIKALEDENRELLAAKSLADEGRQYRADLMAEIERKAGILELNIDLQKALLASADVATLKAYDADLGEKVNAKLGGQAQSKMLGNGAEVLPELRPDPPPVPGQAQTKAVGAGLRTSPFHMWDEE